MRLIVKIYVTSISNVITTKSDLSTFICEQTINFTMQWVFCPSLLYERGKVGLLSGINCCFHCSQTLFSCTLLGLSLTQDVLVKIDIHSLRATRNNLNGNKSLEMFNNVKHAYWIKDKLFINSSEETKAVSDLCRLNFILIHVTMWNLHHEFVLMFYMYW